MAKKKKYTEDLNIDAERFVRTEGFEIGDLVNLVGTNYFYYITEIKDGMYHLSNKKKGQPIFQVHENEIRADKEEAEIERITEVEQSEGGVCEEGSCEIGS